MGKEGSATGMGGCVGWVGAGSTSGRGGREEGGESARGS